MPKDRHKLMYTHDYDFLLERLLQSPVYLCHESQLGTKDSGADLLVVIELHAGRSMQLTSVVNFPTLHPPLTYTRPQQAIWEE
ncbi:hypothetical protein KC320_g276 [Hortaea werneckii]|nr:hypothetical protein KC320_g276 [Hortaea werneckii]